MARAVATSAAFDLLTLAQVRRIDAARAVAHGWSEGLRAIPQERARSPTGRAAASGAAARQPARGGGAAAPPRTRMSDASTCPACGAPLPAGPRSGAATACTGSPGEFDVHVCCGVRQRTHAARWCRPSGSASSIRAAYNAYALPEAPLAAGRRHGALPLALLARRCAARRSASSRGARRAAARRGQRPRRPRRHAGAARVGRHGPGAVTGGLRGVARARGVRTVEGTLSTSVAELADGGFDAVVFQHSLEHVAEPLEDLRAAARLLRPDGARAHLAAELRLLAGAPLRRRLVPSRPAPPPLALHASRPGGPDPRVPACRRPGRARRRARTACP